MSDPATPRHPVRVAAQRSGVNPHVLRAWERRHGVVAPGRSEGGQRLYSDLDVERLRLLNQLTSRGHSIGRLAKLPLDELSQITREEEPSGRSREAEPTMDVRATEFRSAAFRAAQCLAAGELHAVLERAAFSLGVPAFLDQVAAPSIREIGDGWQDGTISVGQEHLATAVFRRVLGWIIETFEINEAAARVVVATPPRQMHELGALMAAAAGGTEGWEVIYLGADLPVSDILGGVRQVGAKALALSIVQPTNSSDLIEDLEQIREGLGPEVHLFLGGAAVTQQPERFSGIGRVMDSLGEFRTALQQLQDQG